MTDERTQISGLQDTVLELGNEVALLNMRVAALEKSTQRAGRTVGGRVPFATTWRCKCDVVQGAHIDACAHCGMERPPESHWPHTPEHELASLAEYHVGRFSGAISRATGGDRAAVAHGLWLLIETAQRRRREWLGAVDDDGG